MRIRPYRTVTDAIDGVVITFVDITLRQRHEQDRARLAAIVESTRDAIIGHDLDGTITSWNAGAKNIFSYRASEAIGKPLGALLGDEGNMAWSAIFKDLAHGEIVEQFDITCTGKDHRQTEVALTMSPISNERGQVIAASTIAHDISEHRRAQAQQAMLMHELSHRVKNALATVQAIVLQTLADKTSMDTFQHVFLERLRALSKSHDLLLGANWQNVSLAKVIDAQLAPYCDRETGNARCELSGPDTGLPPNAALTLSMALHELATNAGKYGALSVPSGGVQLQWELRDSDKPGHQGRLLHLVWSEHGGPPVEPPQQRGYGTRLVEEGLAYELDANVDMDFNPQGVVCTIELSLGPASEQSEHSARSTSSAE